MPNAPTGRPPSRRKPGPDSPVVAARPPVGTDQRDASPVARAFSPPPAAGQAAGGLVDDEPGVQDGEQVPVRGGHAESQRGCLAAVAAVSLSDRVGDVVREGRGAGPCPTVSPRDSALARARSERLITLAPFARLITQVARAGPQSQRRPAWPPPPPSAVPLRNTGRPELACRPPPASGQRQPDAAIKAITECDWHGRPGEHQVRSER